MESVLKGYPIEWLIEENNPSVRYYALKQLLGKSEKDKDVQIAKSLIMQSDIVKDIINLQQEPAYLEAYPRYYTYKYKGLVWALITLAELGASLTPQIKEQCEYLFANSQEKQDGGFSQNTAIKTGGGRITEVIPCLTGNMVWSLAHFGYGDDPRLLKAINWICRFMRFNDGVVLDPQVEPYSNIDMCWGAHTCHMGVVKALKALSVVPQSNLTKEMEDTIQAATEFLLIHHIYKRSHDLSKKSKPGWLRFGFPLMYQTDILEILDILTSLNIKDARMDDAIQIVIKKQNDNGRWVAENTYNSDRLLIPITHKDVESKWITLRALRVLKRYYQN